MCNHGAHNTHLTIWHLQFQYHYPFPKLEGSWECLQAHINNTFFVWIEIIYSVPKEGDKIELLSLSNFSVVQCFLLALEKFGDVGLSNMNVS